MMQRHIAYIIVIILMTLPGMTFAKSEEILGFHSIINVNTDASIDITEEISVYANRQYIIHGIVRELPTRYKDSYGISHKTHYKIISVQVNNQPADYHTGKSSSKLSIYIGSKSISLSPGIYVYTINYHVDDAINFLKDADELYWNITGNGWRFPINKVQADIILPQGAVIGLYNGYTGVKGAKGKDFTVTKISDNQITYLTTRILAPSTGLSIAVSWQKGIVHEPTFTEKLKKQINKSEIILFEILLLSFIYYFYVWYQVGKDPKSGTIIPLFEPPKDLSAAAARYIMKMGFYPKSLPIAITSLATKGLLKINDDKSGLSLDKLTPDNLPTLTADEKIVYEKLFRFSTHLKISKSHRTRIESAQKSIIKILKDTYDGFYFKTNSLYLIPGVFFALLAIIVAIISADDISVASFMVVWLSLWSIGCFTLLYGAFSAVAKFISRPSFTSLISCIGISLFSLPFLIGEILGIAMFSSVLPILTIPLLGLIVMMNIIFYILIKAPTREGRELMDQIEGFKLFLSTTGKYQLQSMNAPKQSSDLFEKYLPYAIALDVENKWAEQFNQSLIDAGKDPAQYQPTWYSGSNFTAVTPALIAGAVSSSLMSSVSTATMSSSSSASGGGGSSGGGGGGGGGGGW